MKRLTLQKVNSQGHVETKYGQKNQSANTISYNPNFTAFTGSVQLEAKMNLLDFDVGIVKEKGHSENTNGHLL